MFGDTFENSFYYYWTNIQDFQKKSILGLILSFCHFIRGWRRATFFSVMIWFARFESPRSKNCQFRSLNEVCQTLSWCSRIRSELSGELKFTSNTILSKLYVALRFSGFGHGKLALEPWFATGPASFQNKIFLSIWGAFLHPWS